MFWDPGYEEEAQVEDIAAHAVLDACHEKNKEIQDLMLLMHSNPLEALVAEIEEKVKASNTFLVFPRRRRL